MIRAFSCILNYQIQCFKALSLKLFLSLYSFLRYFFFSWNDRIQRLELTGVCILRRNCLLKNIKKVCFHFKSWARVEKLNGFKCGCFTTFISAQKFSANILATGNQTLALNEQPLSAVKDLGKSGKTLCQSFTRNSLCSKINFGAIQHGGWSSQIVPNF